MKIATWNVNSVKARHDRLLAVLERHAPDALCLQELKVADDKFPELEVRAAGYQPAVHGQKTYNGVAILAPTAGPGLEDIQIGMQDNEDDPQARIISARLAGVRVICVYVPNGSRPGSDKFEYKLRWLDRLMAYLDTHCDPDEPLALCGDLNIAPEDRDVNRLDEWADSTLCVKECRDAFSRLLDWGLQDTLRLHTPEPGLYSWWDYRMLGFPKNNGLRIDHILATAPLAKRCTAVTIDRNERKGKLPSDHVPVIAEFD